MGQENNPRKSPLRVRRASKQEFSRVLNLLRVSFEGRMDKIEDRLDALENKPKRKRSKKKESETSEEE
jgi:hypothetical protein